MIADFEKAKAKKIGEEKAKRKAAKRR